MVKNIPSNAEDMGSTPGWGADILHATGQLSPHTTTTEARPLQLERCQSAAMKSQGKDRSCRLQLRPDAAKYINI